MEGIECYECGFVATGYEAGIDRCPNEGPDEDHPIIGVLIEDCPNGVTAADWVPGMGLLKKCGSDVHAPRSGKHITAIES